MLHYLVGLPKAHRFPDNNSAAFLVTSTAAHMSIAEYAWQAVTITNCSSYRPATAKRGIRVGGEKISIILRMSMMLIFHPRKINEHISLSRIYNCRLSTVLGIGFKNVALETTVVMLEQLSCAKRDGRRTVSMKACGQDAGPGQRRLLTLLAA